MADAPRPTLTAPFKHTQQLKKGNATLTYVPASEVIDRLNACLGVSQWSFACETAHADESYVVVKGRLTVPGGATYEQYGGQVVNKKKDGNPLDLGDDFKGAASDALKKCAQMIGVGLYLALGHSATISGAASDLTAPPAPDTSSSGSGTEASKSLSEPPQAPAPAGEPAPPGSEVDAASNGAVSASDPLDKFSAEAVNKRVAALSDEQRALFLGAKRGFDAERFVIEATEWLDAREAEAKAAV